MKTKSALTYTYVEDFGVSRASGRISFLRSRPDNIIKSDGSVNDRALHDVAASVDRIECTGGCPSPPQPRKAARPAARRSGIEDRLDLFERRPGTTCALVTPEVPVFLGMKDR